MIILSVDSSAVSASAALFDGDRILGEFIINTGLTHSQTLMPAIDSLLKNTGTDISSIDAFAVSVGPGSFTGLRIGIAAVKGMALGLGKPCVEVSTLETIAYNGINLCDGIICAVMDARCNQVYNALFESVDGKLNRLTDDRAITIDELADEIEKYGKVYLIGDGAFVAYNGMQQIKDCIIMLNPSQMYQKASSVAELAFKKYENSETVSYSDLRPVYLRLPQAERELNNKLKKESMEDK